MLTAFGGGVTWATSIFRWGERVMPLGMSDAALPTTELTVFDLLEPNRQFFAPLHRSEASTEANGHLGQDRALGG
jgi:3-oxoacyl-[acyl-carrier-protein] synthase-3